MPLSAYIVGIKENDYFLAAEAIGSLPPDLPSWGVCSAAKGADTWRSIHPWPLLPGLALATVIYGVNVFGDAVRDLIPSTKTHEGNEVWVL